MDVEADRLATSLFDRLELDPKSPQKMCLPLYALAAEAQLGFGRYEEPLEQHKRILYVNSRIKDSDHPGQQKSQAGLASP